MKPEVYLELLTLELPPIYLVFVTEFFLANGIVFHQTRPSVTTCAHPTLTRSKPSDSASVCYSSILATFGILEAISSSGVGPVAQGNRVFILFADGSVALANHVFISFPKKARLKGRRS